MSCYISSRKKGKLLKLFKEILLKKNFQFWVKGHPMECHNENDSKQTMEWLYLNRGPHKTKVEEE